MTTPENTEQKLTLTAEDGPFCQSCCMPMKQEEQFGTNKDGGMNKEYCIYCYKDGEFTEPNITLDEMVKKVGSILRSLELPEDFVKQVCDFIPTLKRWKKD